MAVLALFAISCNSPEKKTQKLIKTYLLKNLNDAKSYESVSFGVLVESKTRVEDDIWYKTYIEVANNYLDTYKIFNDFEALDSANVNLERAKDVEKSFTAEREWAMTHKYRAKNGLGATILRETIFYIDDEITYVKRLLECN